MCRGGLSRGGVDQLNMRVHIALINNKFDLSFIFANLANDILHFFVKPQNTWLKQFMKIRKKAVGLDLQIVSN